MTEIILIRHGETDWNAERRLQGFINIPLNEHGQKQALAVGRALQAEQIDAVIASDLQRAAKTAEAIAAPHGKQVVIDQGLRERCFGAFEGLLYDDIGNHYPEAHLAMKARQLDVRFPDGENIAETLREFYARSLGTIMRLASVQQYRKIVVVTHGGVLDCAYRAAKGMDLSLPRDFDILNASINRLGWDGNKFHIVQWSEVAHLRDSVLDELGS